MAAWDIRILSSRAESISHEFASLTRERYFQHEKIKFVSPRSHVISSVSLEITPFFTWFKTYTETTNGSQQLARRIKKAEI